jgi:hypothetical protein
MLVIEWVDHCPSDETGRRAGFKIQWGQPRVGSTPTSGTITLCYHRVFKNPLRFKTFLCIQAYLGVSPERYPSLASGNA